MKTSMTEVTNTEVNFDFAAKMADWLMSYKFIWLLVMFLSVGLLLWVSETFVRMCIIVRRCL